MSKYDDAIKRNDKAIEIDGKNATAWSNKGHALDKHGKHEDAKNTLIWQNSLEVDKVVSIKFPKEKILPHSGKQLIRLYFHILSAHAAL